MIEDEIRAFPRPMVGSGTTGATAEQDGMTLRDWFAGQAAAALIAHSITAAPNPDGPETCAQAAYRFADAMLEARKK